MTRREFLWGAATAAHQIEGNNTASDWWRLEQSGHPRIVEPSGAAMDSYNRWGEDMDLLAGAGFTDYRFSVEWARIEPSPGRIDREQISHYDDMITGAIERGLRPMVTLHHFTVPQWFEDAGGWTAPAAIEQFAAYVEAVCPILESRVRRVCTINEPNIIALMPALLSVKDGIMPMPDPALTDAMIRAHHAARAVLRAHDAGIGVGWSVASLNPQPDPRSAEDVTAIVADLRQVLEAVFYRAARDDDWVGVQAYSRKLIGCVDGTVTIGQPPDGTPMTINGWEVYPEALGEAVQEAALSVGTVPIIVTENGIATADDDERIAYTTQALAGLRLAMADGVDVRGYFHWSLLDNYEWGSFAPTFGLVSVDRTTFTRTPKPSLRWLGGLGASFLSGGEPAGPPMPS
ncbi:MAG TPA: family 1 glycosylhydrolase [Mycobacteriales bacterium]|nr:family 1 glycosylhydrolase [Mycobacteriales bacterium]